MTPTHTSRNLMSRLARGGFPTDFVKKAILPEWWDRSCFEEPGLLQDLEIRVARFLGTSLENLRENQEPLGPPNYSSAQLRHVRNIDRDRLSASIHAALRIAGAVVRNLRNLDRRVDVPPRNPLDWRVLFQANDQVPQLPDLLQDLWSRGIPVIHAETLPSPTFQGLACIVEERPVVMLGRNHDEPSRVAHIVSHEVGHITNGDCLPGQPVVDEREDILDEDEIELLADQYALTLLTGDIEIPIIEAESARELAQRASEVEGELGVDSGTVVWSWANRTRNFQLAAMALRALYQARGARVTVRRFFEQGVDIENASESDRALLGCVWGDPTSGATAD